LAWAARPSPEDRPQNLREATRKIAPDWELSTQSLRNAWEAGGRSSFYDASTSA
jgi:hypothetical protein